MKPIGDFEEAESQILAEVTECLESIHKVVGGNFGCLKEGIAALLKIRQEAYEDMNQILHAELVLRAARLLKGEFPNQDIEWFWNPKQTGDHSEPDLTGRTRASVVFSAEVTGSDRPIGTIDSRMSKTLDKLSTMQGLKYYFVRTKEMEARAKTKVSNKGLSIEVRLIKDALAQS